MKLSLRDKTAEPVGEPYFNRLDKMRDRQENARQNPSLEEFQRGLNKAKPSEGNQPPAASSPARLPKLVKKIKDWVENPNGFLGIFQDENGNPIKVISKDKNKVFWRSDFSSAQTAFVKERKRRINAAVNGLKVKSSKEDWIAARERLTEKLMQEKGWSWENVEQFLDTSPEGQKMMEDYAVDYAADKAEYLYTMMGG